MQIAAAATNHQLVTGIVSLTLISETQQTIDRRCSFVAPHRYLIILGPSGPQRISNRINPAARLNGLKAINSHTHLEHGHLPTDLEDVCE